MLTLKVKRKQIVLRMLLLPGLDSNSTNVEIRYSSFVQSRGQELLDLSLYVSSQNYTTVTRPIYSKLQHFPLPYITPPSLRARAKARTDHLGLSNLDIDSTDDATNQNEKSIIPESLRRPKASLQGLLSQSEAAARIRLEALTISFCKPLQELRGNRRFFLSDFLTSLDCLALAYLSLALLPDMPSPWLATSMRTKFPMLCAFVHDLRENFFGSNITLEEAGLAIEHENSARLLGKGKLPWKAPERGSLLSIAGVLGTNIMDQIPIISHLRQNQEIRASHEAEGDEESRDAAREITSVRNKELLTTVGIIVAGVGLFMGFLFQQGVITVSGADKQQLNQEETFVQLNDDILQDEELNSASALDILSSGWIS